MESVHFETFSSRIWRGQQCLASMQLLLISNRHHPGFPPKPLDVKLVMEFVQLEALFAQIW